MRTPSRITVSAFSDSLKYFLDACCVLRGNTLCCSTCGASMQYVRAALSIHDESCAGCEDPDQRVWNTVAPYLPKVRGETCTTGLSIYTCP